MMNAPEKRPPVPAVEARAMTDAGIGTGSTSSMISADRTSRLAMAK
jgi:hypothetical protein